jgi:hypothetical protein
MGRFLRSKEGRDERLAPVPANSVAADSPAFRLRQRDGPEIPEKPAFFWCGIGIPALE